MYRSTVNIVFNFVYSSLSLKDSNIIVIFFYFFFPQWGKTWRMKRTTECNSSRKRQKSCASWMPRQRRICVRIQSCMNITWHNRLCSMCPSENRFKVNAASHAELLLHEHDFGTWGCTVCVSMTPASGNHIWTFACHPACLRAVTRVSFRFRFETKQIGWNLANDKNTCRKSHLKNLSEGVTPKHRSPE